MEVEKLRGSACFYSLPLASDNKGWLVHTCRLYMYVVKVLDVYVNLGRLILENTPGKLRESKCPRFCQPKWILVVASLVLLNELLMVLCQSYIHTEGKKTSRNADQSGKTCRLESATTATLVALLDANMHSLPDT